MNLDLVRNVLLRIDKMKVGESMLIDDLNKEFPNFDSNEFLTLIFKLASRYYVRIDGKYAHDCFNIEKYNKISGLERDGLEAIDYIKNDKIWEKVKNYLNQNGYTYFTIFTVVELSKKIIHKEFENILDN